MAAVLTLQEMADKAASLLGIDPSLSLTQKVAKANDIAGVKPYGMSLKQQVDNVEKLIRKAAFNHSSLGILASRPASARTSRLRRLSRQ